ncbi:hypothetical protein ACPV50_20660, partial [Vibrio astriarenae]
GCTRRDLNVDVRHEGWIPWVSRYGAMATLLCRWQARRVARSEMEDRAAAESDSITGLWPVRCQVLGNGASCTDDLVLSRALGLIHAA